MLTVHARHPEPDTKTREPGKAPVDAAKVARLRAAIKNRCYRPSAAAIAEIMLGISPTLPSR